MYSLVSIADIKHFKLLTLITAGILELMLS